MPIKTNLKPEQLMKLNSWIKTIEQAEKILHDVKTKPNASLPIINKRNLYNE